MPVGAWGKEGVVGEIIVPLLNAKQGRKLYKCTLKQTGSWPHLRSLCSALAQSVQVCVVTGYGLQPSKVFYLVSGEILGIPHCGLFSSTRSIALSVYFLFWCNLAVLTPRLMRDVQESNSSRENVEATGIRGPQSPAGDRQSFSDRFVYCLCWSEPGVSNPP